MFAIERDNGLKSIIDNIYQSFDGNDVYNSIEEKASNFLYMIFKGHVLCWFNKEFQQHYLSIFYLFMKY